MWSEFITTINPEWSRVVHPWYLVSRCPFSHFSRPLHVFIKLLTYLLTYLPTNTLISSCKQLYLLPLSTPQRLLPLIALCHTLVADVNSSSFCQFVYTAGPAHSSLHSRWPRFPSRCSTWLMPGFHHSVAVSPFLLAVAVSVHRCCCRCVSFCCLRL